MARASIDTSIWGEHFWKALTYAAIGYPEENPTEVQQNAFLSWFMALQIVLPCETCRGHYKQYWDEHDIRPALVSKAHLKLWILNLHNAVNQRLEKKVWTMAEFDAAYEPKDEDEEEEEKARELSLMKANPVIPPPIPKRARPRYIARTTAQAAAGGQKKKANCKNCGRKW